MAKVKRKVAEQPEPVEIKQELPKPKPVGRPPKMVRLVVLIDERFMTADPKENIEAKLADARISEIRERGISLKPVGGNTTIVFPGSIYGIRKQEL